MSDVRPQDILFRAGGGTLRRLQALVSGGASRVEVAHTFTRATVRRAFRDRDGTARRAAAGNLAIDWPAGLVDASGNPIGGPLVEGARTQLVSDPENFGAWTLVSAPTVTSGKVDPFGGTTAYNVGEADAAGNRFITHAITFTGSTTKGVSLGVRKGAVSPATGARINIQDSTAVADRLFALLTWSGATPVLTMNTGTFLGKEDWGSGWWRLLFQTTAITSGNSHLYRILPASVTAEMGDLDIYSAQAWDATFPSGYQAPTELTGVADALTSPYNFGPQSDLTVLVRLGRPYHADALGALGVSPGIFSFGAGTAPRIGAYFDPAARNIIGVIDTATTDATVSAAIPAGHPTVLFQFKNLTTGGQVAIDTGSGLSAFSSAATAFSAFSSQTVRLGRYDDELYGVLGDVVVMRGLFSRTEALAVA